MICPRPGLQRKCAAAALSQAGRAEPDQPIRAIQPAADRMYATDVRQTDVRQHHRLMPPWAGGIVRIMAHAQQASSMAHVPPFHRIFL